MKLLRIIASLDPRTGGPAEGIRAISPLLAARGHQAEVVTFDPPGAAYLADFPIPVSALGPVPAVYGYASRLVPWLRRNAGRFDAAILHGLWNYSSYGGWRGLGHRLPYVVFTHGMLDPWFNSVQPLKRWAKQAYWLVAEGRVLSDARAVLFTTDEERRRARTSFFGHPYRERVVAYGASDIPDREAEQRAAFAAAVPDLAGRPYLLFMSRIHPKKGCDLLIRAFAEVEAAPETQLVMAGPDQVGLIGELQSLAASAGIAGRTHWPGMLTGDAKWGALRGAEAFVLPSHQENFGIAAAEAMAASTPVLISDKVNIWREVEAGGAGLVEADTGGGTRALLERFSRLPRDERSALGERARATYVAKFGIEGAANDLEQVLAECAARMAA